ncbi:MAG TPA: hypothetical protein VFY44_10175 [Thermoleophilaceae bacterium]|nr:hypothetical protein [Thermoleophilaceae bacterium]
MKTFSAALAALLAVSAVAAATAQAVTPKTGKWKVTLDGVPVPPGGTAGGFKVSEKKGKLYVSNFLSPEYYVKCTGQQAALVERNPGFPTTWGTSNAKKLSAGAGFKGRFPFKSGKTTRADSYTGKFTSRKKASGTVRTTIKGDPLRACDSGALKWKATR